MIQPLNNMKKILTLLSAALVLFACNPTINPGPDPSENPSSEPSDNPSQEPSAEPANDPGISKVTLTIYMEGRTSEEMEKHHQEISVPNFDANGRLTGYSREVWLQEVEWPESGSVIMHFVKSVDETVTFTYDDTAKKVSTVYKGISYNYNEDCSDFSEEPFEDDPVVMQFDENWCYVGDPLLAYYYKDSYLSGIGSKNVVWRDGDMVVCGDCDIQYGTEPNTLASTLDYSLYEALGEEYAFGFLGKRCAHLPIKIVDHQDGFDIINECSATKDSEGRITSLKFQRLDSETGEKLGRYSLIEYEYK